MFFLLEEFRKHKSADYREDGNIYMWYVLFLIEDLRTVRYTELLGALQVQGLVSFLTCGVVLGWDNLGC